MGQRLLRAKHKIREAGIPFRVPVPETLSDRLPDVLQVVCLMFTEGHRASRGGAPTQGELCDEAISLARRLRSLIGEEPEVDGLLALLLLTDARRSSRSDRSGRIVLLADQDRLAWDRSMIGEGLALVDVALSGRRPGPYQLQAAIAACHASADEFTSTDWPQIAALYDRLFAHQPSPVVAANRAIAVSMSDGPAVGLALLDQLREGTTTARWAPLHIARAELLQHLGRRDEALAACRLAAELQPPQAERELIAERIATLTGSQLPEAPEN